MNADAINNVLRARCRGFLGVFAADRLPSRLPPTRPILLVANIDAHDKPGQHWVALYIGRDSRGEYFDSLAQKPIDRFKRYLDRFCNSWIQNERQLQSAVSYFCGHYAIFYCLYRSLGYSLGDILNCFGRDTGLNDYIVHNVVCRGIM